MSTSDEDETGEKLKKRIFERFEVENISDFKLMPKAEFFEDGVYVGPTNMNNFDDGYGRKVRVFKLSEGFLTPFKTKADPMDPLGRLVFKRTYAREKEYGFLFIRSFLER